MGGEVAAASQATDCLQIANAGDTPARMHVTFPLAPGVAM